MSSLTNTTPDQEDKVNKPLHYTQGIETADYIESWEMDFFEGNVVKYVTRAPYKGKPVEDYKKAMWYLQRLINRYE